MSTGTELRGSLQGNECRLRSNQQSNSPISPTERKKGSVCNGEQAAKTANEQKHHTSVHDSAKRNPAQLCESRPFQDFPNRMSGLVLRVLDEPNSSRSQQRPTSS